MDMVSINNTIPLLIGGDGARLSEKEKEKQKKLEQKAKQTKVLMALDSESKDTIYIQYKMRLKNEVSPTDIRYVHRLIDQMEACSKMTGVNVLREGKTICDLKNAFNEMLYSNTICFDKLREFYDTGRIDGIVMEKPVKVFLSLFDIEEEKRGGASVIEEKIQQSSRKKKESWIRLRACIKSAPYNTILISNIQNRRQKYKEERKIGKTIASETAKQKRK